MKNLAHNELWLNHEKMEVWTDATRVSKLSSSKKISIHLRARMAWESLNDIVNALQFAL